MVANVTRSHIQTAQDIFILLKGPDPSYLVLKFGNILPVNNLSCGPKCDFANVLTLKGQGHRSKQITPSDSLTSKT